VLAAWPGGARASGPGSASAGAASERPSALLLFVPADEAQMAGVPGLSMGIMSASQGQYATAQLLLDITQGARVASSAYTTAKAPALSLATSGAGFQALLRNPLADPYVLGIASGAALGAMLSLMFAPQVPGAIQAAAFAGAAVTTAAVYFLGRRGGKLDSATLLLAGIISASFLSAAIMFLGTTLSGRDQRGMAFWIMGDLASPPSLDLHWLYLLLIVAISSIYTTSSDLNLILTGEQEARHLGVNVNRVKLVVYIAASLLTGLAVSVAGAIGYVGLIVPHVMRMIFGTDYRLLIPASAIGGAIAIVLADTLARTVVAPTELPVGAMTALAGAPVFIYLMRRSVR